jgi:hypothetical protein
MTCLELDEWLHCLIVPLRRVVNQLDCTERSYADSYIGDIWPAIHQTDSQDGDAANLWNVVFALTFRRLNAQEDFNICIYRENFKSYLVEFIVAFPPRQIKLL